MAPCCFQLYYPTSQGLKNLLQALDTDSRLDLLPTIWKGERAGSPRGPRGRVKEIGKLTSGCTLQIFARWAMTIRRTWCWSCCPSCPETDTLPRSVLNTWKKQQKLGTGETTVGCKVWQRRGGGGSRAQHRVVTWKLSHK